MNRLLAKIIFIKGIKFLSFFLIFQLAIISFWSWNKKYLSQDIKQNVYHYAQNTQSIDYATIFTTLVQDLSLRDIANWKLTLVDGVSVSELAKIDFSTWQVNNIFAQFQVFNSKRPYNEFERLVWKNRLDSSGSARTTVQIVQEIRKKIEQAIDNKLERVLKEKVSTTPVIINKNFKDVLAQIYTYRLQEIKGISTVHLSKMDNLKTITFATLKSHDPTYQEWCNLVFKYIKQSDDNQIAHSIANAIHDMVDQKLRDIFEISRLKTVLVQIHNYRLSNIGAISVANLNTITNLNSITFEDFGDYQDVSSGDFLVYQEWQKLVSQYITQSDGSISSNDQIANSIIRAINIAVEQKLQSVFEIPGFQIVLVQILMYHLNNINGVKIFHLSSIINLNNITFAALKSYGQGQAYQEWGNLVFRHTTQNDGSINSDREVARSIINFINVAVEQKLQSVFENPRVQSALKRMRNYRIKSIDTNNYLHLLDNADDLNTITFAALKTYGDGSNYGQAYYEWRNLVLKHISQSDGSASSNIQIVSAIVNSIDDAIESKVKEIFQQTDLPTPIKRLQDALLQIHTYHLSDVGGVETVNLNVVDNLNAITFTTLKNYVNAKNQRQAYQEWQNLVLRYISQSDGSASSNIQIATTIVNNIAKTVANKVKDIFENFQLRTYLTKIHTYRLQFIANINVPNLQNINNLNVISAINKFKTQHQGAYNEFIKLIQKFSKGRTASEIVAKIQEAINAAIVKKILHYIWNIADRTKMIALFDGVKRLSTTSIFGVNVAALFQLQNKLIPGPWDWNDISKEQEQQMVALFQALPGLNLTDKMQHFRLNVIFLLVRTDLVKLHVHNIGSVDVSKISQIADWSKIKELNDLKTLYPEAYDEFRILIQKFSKDRTANEIVTKIQEAINTAIVRKVLHYIWNIADRAKMIALFGGVKRLSTTSIFGVNIAALFQLQNKLIPGPWDWNDISKEQEQQMVALFQALPGIALVNKMRRFRLNVIFLLVRTDLVKLHVRNIGSVDVSKISQIADWNKIKELNDLQTHHPQAYGEFMMLVQKFPNHVDLAQTIIDRLRVNSGGKK